MQNIPKIAHFCWFGTQPIPPLNVFTLVTFHRLNPDWEMRLYISNERSKEFGSLEWIPPYQGEDMLSEIKKLDYVQIIETDLAEYECPQYTHFIAATDVFRQQVLLKYGGIYSDMDVIWLRPMSYFTELDCIGDVNDFQCTVSFFKTTEGHHNVSNIVAEKGSEFLRYTLEKCKTVQPPFTHQAFGTDLFNRLFPTKNTIDKLFKRMLFLKYETFFPYSIYSLENLYQKHDIEPAYQKNCMAVHWFGGHPYSHAYIDGDGFNRNCALTSILKIEGLI